MSDFEFIGLDTASNRVHAVHQRYRAGEFEILGVWEFHAGKDIADIRRGELYRASGEYFAMLSELSPGCHVFCEEPMAGQNGQTTRVLCLAAGAIWTAHLGLDLMWHWVVISHWKRVILNKGSATKAEIRAWSLKHGGSKEWEEDHFDAHGIGIGGAEDLIAHT